MERLHNYFFQVLRLSQVTVGKLSIGHVINLASNDVQRYDLVRHVKCRDY